jgi:hypothetical protein
MRSNLTALLAAAWFACNGLLWFVRPPDAIWLLGSSLLGVLFFGA